MKKGNWSVVKLLGYVISGLGAIAIVNTNTKQTQANQPEPVTETTTPYSRSRHIITLTLNQLDELKVTEGQRINVGGFISDRAVPRFARSHIYHNQATSQKEKIRNCHSFS